MMGRRLYITCLTLFLALAVAGGDSFAQTKEIEGQKARIKQLEEDIMYLDSQIQSTQTRKKNTMDELVLIQGKIANRKALLDALDKEIALQTREIADTQNEIKEMEQRLDTLEHYYSRMIYNAYKHRDTKVWFMYILASDNMEQGYRRWSYLKNYSKSISAQADKIRGLKEDHKRELKKLQQLKNSNLKAQADRAEEYKALTLEEKQSQAFAKSLEKQQNQYRKQLAQKRKEADNLAREVERLIAAEIKRQQEIARKQEELARKAELARKKAQAAKEAQQQNAAPSEQKAPPMEYREFAQSQKLGNSFAVNRGKLPYPVSQGVVIEKFGEHPHPTLKNVKLPFNNGINISTKPGTQVKVVFDGTVKQVIAIPGYNQCVLVQHGQYFTFYCKLAKVDVKVGDKLSTGNPIGSLETQGSTAVLHFELWNGITKQNPELWLKK